MRGALTFYGSSFISDPYGRILARAPRDESAVLVAALDLDARRDWLTLFPFLRTRRPETYGAMTRQPQRLGPGRAGGRRTCLSSSCLLKPRRISASTWPFPPAATPWGTPKKRPRRPAPLGPTWPAR
ncbi:nitrilase-related carbon-nitrogen hydrolase [Glutamicibacter halophytocola]|uniref:nitrilase-related carbon-nitrogen hydrolase n=1 Tax=Glutamicibacter halophytocola TaxID=1933880 RepID=UPI00321AC64E